MALFGIPDFNINIPSIVQATSPPVPATSVAAPTHSSNQELLQKISTLQSNIATLKTQNATLNGEKKVLQGEKTGLKQVNTKLLAQVNTLRQQSAEGDKNKTTVTKILNLAVQVIQEADSATNNATKAKSDAADLLKQSETSVANAKTSKPDSNEAKTAESIHLKAKTAKTNVVRKATAVQATSKKLEDLANDLITGKTKIDNQSEANIKKEQAALVKDSKGLSDAITTLQKDVGEVTKQAEALAKQVVKQVVTVVAPTSENWNVIGPLFGFGTPSAGVETTSAVAGGGSAVDNWSVIEKLFGFSGLASTPSPASKGNGGAAASATTKKAARPVDQFQERFRAVNDISKSLGFAAGFPNFQQADRGNGIVYGTILIKPEYIESKNILAKDLGNPTDEAARFRAIYNWATKNGFAAGFPNFHQADDGKGLQYGALLLKKGAVEWKDIPTKDLGNLSDYAARLSATHDWATKNGFVGGFPNFHKADHGKGVVYGTLLLKKRVAESRDILAADLSKV